MANNTGFSFLSLLDDINTIDNIDKHLDDIANAVDKKIALLIGVSNVFIDYTALYQALVRYSKDVYGYTRVESIINSNLNDDSLQKFMLDEIRTSSGFMLETNNPHLNKKLAYLVYHLSCMKPFTAEKIDNSFSTKLIMDYIQGHFNEIITYHIVKLILKNYGNNLNLKGANFKYFIHSIRFRNIARSSLEMVFENIICISHSKKSSEIN